MSLNPKFKNQSHVKKQMNALHGLITAFRSEPALSTEITVGIIATVSALIVGNQWWFVKQTLMLTVAVILAELINTAFEYLSDLVEPHKNPKVKNIKDILAGVVLLVTVLATIITIVDLLFILNVFS